VKENTLLGGMPGLLFVYPSNMSHEVKPISFLEVVVHEWPSPENGNTLTFTHVEPITTNGRTEKVKQIARTNQRYMYSQKMAELPKSQKN
jgi:hypothetical protein